MTKGRTLIVFVNGTTNWYLAQIENANKDTPLLPIVRWEFGTQSQIKLLQHTYINAREWATFLVDKEIPKGIMAGHRWCWLSTTDIGTIDLVNKKRINKDPNIDDVCYINQKTTRMTILQKQQKTGHC
jgi:hypothetical protein